MACGFWCGVQYMIYLLQTIFLFPKFSALKQQGPWINFETGGGTISDSILGGGTKQFFLLICYNFGNIGRAHAPPPPPTLRSPWTACKFWWVRATMKVTWFLISKCWQVWVWPKPIRILFNIILLYHLLGKHGRLHHVLDIIISSFFTFHAKSNQHSPVAGVKSKTVTDIWTKPSEICGLSREARATASACLGPGYQSCCRELKLPSGRTGFINHLLAPLVRGCFIQYKHCTYDL